MKEGRTKQTRPEYLTKLKRILLSSQKVLFQLARIAQIIDPGLQFFVTRAARYGLILGTVIKEPVVRFLRAPERIPGMVIRVGRGHERSISFVIGWQNRPPQGAL